LLSGVNAAGKSTVMQALALLRQSFDAGMLSANGGGLLLNGDLIDLGVGQDVLHEDYATDRGQEHPLISVGIERDGRHGEWTVRYERALHREADVLPLAATPELFDDLSLFLNGFQYLKADRIVPSVHYPKSYEAAVRRGFLGARGEHTVNYLRVRGEDRWSRSDGCGLLGGPRPGPGPRHRVAPPPHVDPAGRPVVWQAFPCRARHRGPES